VPAISTRHRFLFAVGHLSPTLLDPNCLYPELLHIALKLPDHFLATPDHWSTTPAVHLRCRPHCPHRAAVIVHPDLIPTAPKCALTW
jgi:hypothetical protein